MKPALTLTDQTLLRAGTANGIAYGVREIAPLASILNESPPDDQPEQANRDSLFLDHGDGTGTWVGYIDNFHFDKSSNSLRGDVHIIDQPVADKINFQKYKGRSRFGISPRLLIDEKDGKAQDIKVKSFSLVLNPAGGEELMLTFKTAVLKIDDAKRIVLGPVLIPDVIDLQNEIISAEEIEKAAHNFLKSLINGNARPGQMHKDFTGDISVIESYIMPADTKINDHVVKKGTWMLGVHIPDDKAWQKVKTGKYQGFSVGGFARKVPVN